MACSHKLIMPLIFLVLVVATANGRGEFHNSHPGDIVASSHERNVAITGKPRAVTEGSSKRSKTPICHTVISILKGDTCYSTIHIFGIPTPHFYAINPNIDCDNLFEGQWVCIVGEI